MSRPASGPATTGSRATDPDRRRESPLAVRGLTVSYRQRPAVLSLDATFPARSLSAIVGPNGAGKSTFLKAVLGIVPRLSGEATVFGTPLAAARRRIAYVPQRAAVDWDFPTTALDVVLMGLYRRLGLVGRLGRRHREAARACLAQVGMAEFAGRQIGQLSGGQQQRVFLARALAQEAEVYLLDEPFAGVDAATERAVVAVLRQLKGERKAVICVHHDLATLAAYFDYLFLINVRKIAEGPVATAFTAEALQTTYGGQLAAAHLAQLDLPQRLSA